MTSKIFKYIGLILGIMGAIFLFLWAQPNFDEGIPIGPEDATPINAPGKIVAQYNEEIRRKNKV